MDHVLFSMIELAERNVPVKQLVWGSIHIAPEKFKNAALRSRHENGVFLKTFFKVEKFENVGFSSSCGRKTFWKQSLTNTMVWRWSRDFSDRGFVKDKSKITGDCVFK